MPPAIATPAPSPPPPFPPCAPLVIVLNANDSGPGSLRQALAEVCPGGSVPFAPGLSGQTIQLTSGQLVLDKNLTLQGPGANLLAGSGNASSRVLSISPGVSSLLAGLTLANGNGLGMLSPGHGGGIYNAGKFLTISNCTLSGNSTATHGGGIYNRAGSTLAVTRSSLSGNSSVSYGGGIENLGTLTVNESTFSGNSAGPQRGRQPGR